MIILTFLTFSFFVLASCFTLLLRQTSDSLNTSCFFLGWKQKPFKKKHLILESVSRVYTLVLLHNQSNTAEVVAPAKTQPRQNSDPGRATAFKALDEQCVRLERGG